MATEAATTPVIDIDSLVSGDANPPLVWEAILGRAIDARVSDVHVLARRDNYRLSFRIDGDLLPQGNMSRPFARHLISHVKTMGEIDLAEHRRPTEGHCKMTTGGRGVDMRISTIPTVHGEDMVVRIFDREVGLRNLDELGMLAEQYEALRDMIDRPSGLILVSGPSGAGKTTTLYAILQHLVRRQRKIVTIENPVEYDLEGVNQTQVNPRIGLNFANMLRAIMRQDPDIIMVGEVRDEETARTAVRAANTGHLVLATTHSARAARAVETMLSLGVHPYFLGTALRCVIAQVLVKTICLECKTALNETADMIIEPAVRKRLADGEPGVLHEGTGCDACHQSGYSGRTGLFELFIPDDAARKLILENRPAEEISEAAEEAEVLDIEQAGKLKVIQGITTLEQFVEISPAP
ncbi:MAG: GspE/PulE family protein [Planctomycetota bacterium]